MAELNGVDKFQLLVRWTKKIRVAPIPARCSSADRYRCVRKSVSMMQLVLKVSPSRSKDGLESLYIDNLIAIKKTKAYSNLVIQIRVAPILQRCGSLEAMR